MTRTKVAMFGGIVSLLTALTAVTAHAQSPQASGQYGYGGPMPSPQSGGGAYPVPCHEKVGCYVVVGCPPACHVKAAPQIYEELKRYPVACHQPPPCQNAEIVELITEEAPQKVYVDIWRNHYVPVVIRKIPHYPQGVTAFDVRVNYRQVHVLCDVQGNPIPPSKVGEVLKELEQQLAANAPGGPATAPGAPAAASPPPSEAAPPITSTPPAPAPTAAAAPSQAPATAGTSIPAAPVPTAAAAPGQAPAAQPTATQAQADTPAKNWIWLAQYNAYAYGYQRPDGYYVIDQGSLRATAPQQQ